MPCNAHWADVEYVPQKYRKENLKYTNQTSILTYCHTRTSAQRQRRNRTSRTPLAGQPLRDIVSQRNKVRVRVRASKTQQENSMWTSPKLSPPTAANRGTTTLREMWQGQKLPETMIPHRDGLEPSLAGTAQLHKYNLQTKSTFFNVQIMSKVNPSS